jgi:hypothetical protein
LVGGIPRSEAVKIVVRPLLGLGIVGFYITFIFFFSSAQAMLGHSTFKLRSAFGLLML